MKKVAQFEKVSFKQFKKDWEKSFGVIPTNLLEIYNQIKLPTRATKNSAGYDFFSPISFSLLKNHSITIPTGIRCKIVDNFVLQIYPRSGLGFKFMLQLCNTVGIIDADYYDAENEGHIQVKLVNQSNENKIVNVQEGQGFAQGVFMEYGITFDDVAENERLGGFGSTDL